MPTLAQAVRAKYPGTYDDLSDAELEAKIRAKYPDAYKDLPDTPTGPQGSAAGRFVGGVAEQLNPITAITGAAQAVMHPIDTASNIAGQMGQQWREGLDLAAQGRLSEGIGHTVAGTLPVVGPAAAEIGEQIGAGDVAGGLGRGVGLVASIGAPSALKAAGPRLREVAAATKPAAAFAGDVGLNALKNLVLEGDSPRRAVMQGVKEAIKDRLKPAARARIEHAVKRSTRAVVEEAKTAAPKPALKLVSKAEAVDLTPEALMADLKKRVTALHGLGVEPKDIAHSLTRVYENQGRAEGLTVGKMRTMVDAVIQDIGSEAKAAAPKAAAKAVRTLTDDMADFVIGQAELAGTSRAQIAASLRELYPEHLTDSAARKVVDFTLDQMGRGPANTAAETAARQGISFNEQIRSARSRVNP